MAALPGTKLLKLLRRTDEDTSKVSADFPNQNYELDLVFQGHRYEKHCKTIILPIVHYKPFWKRNLHTPRDNRHLYSEHSWRSVSHR